MKIILAKEMGFCPGVRRAIKMAEQEAGKGPISTLGSIIHNPQEVDRLASLGVQPVSEPPRESGSRIAVTAHGAPPATYREAAECQLTVVDMTCPLVTKVQKLAAKLTSEDYFVIVYGDVNHQEVQGILGWAGKNSAAARTLEELLERVPGLAGKPVPHKLAAVSQTTQNVFWFASFCCQLLDHFLPIAGEVAVHNTICAPTRQRQESVLDLAKEVDLILVIGGKESANSKHLVQLAQEAGAHAYQIESADDINPAWLTGKETIGLTAGASTPDSVIEEVVAALKQG